MDYSLDYGGGPVIQFSPRGRGQFQKKWLFDTDDLKAGSIALNVEATYIPRSDRPRSMVIADAGMVPDYTSVDSASEEIERKSARIQRELQRERRARSVSPRRGVPVAAPSYSAALPPRSARAAPTTPRQVPVAVTPHMEFPSDPSAADNLGYHIENADKMILGQELKTLRGALFTTKLQIREAEKEAKHVKHRTEETRSELVLVEYKRATAHKDLDRLVDDLERKRVMVDTCDMEIEAKQRELRGFQSIDITPEEAKLLHEENVDLNQRHRSLEVAHLETVELGSQLTSAKDDLLREQKQFRRQREQMVEEVETLRARLEESQKGWGLAQREVAVLEEAFGRMEQNKNDIIQEQSKEYTAFKMLARHESQENRQMLSHQVEVLNKELLQLQVRVTDLQADLKAKDEHSLKLSKQLTTLTQELTAEQSARAAEPEKHRQTLQRLRKETDSAMLKLKESLFLDKQRALENLRTEIERERKDNSSRSDERVAQMLAENAQLLSEKNGEITRLQERLKEMQETNRAAERRMLKKVDLQIREAVSREQAAMEKETQWKLQNERENLARDTKQRVNEMQLTLDHEREASQRMTREMEQLKEDWDSLPPNPCDLVATSAEKSVLTLELEEQRRLNREAAKEKLVAVARAKDQIRDQSNAELENMRQKVKQEMQLEVDRLQSQLRSTEEELGTLRAENQRLMGRERDNLHSLDYTEKTVISELNQECRRSASVLGVSPRQVSLSAVTDSASGRSQLNAALANLRAVNEELRKHIEELTSELDSCRAMITTMEKEKEHTQELASVAQASTHQSLQTSMVVALRRKEDEIAQLQDALTACRAESTDDKHALVLRNDEMKQELEKYCCVIATVPYQQRLRHSSSEQKRISQTQEREIARLETHVDRLALTYSSTNWNHHSLSPTTTHHHHHPQHQQHQHHQQHHHQQHQQQQYLQARIQQLHHENNTLRRKHLLSKNSLSTSDLPVTCASPSFPTSPSPVTTLLTGGDTDLMTTDRTSNGTNICRTVAEIPGLGGYLLPKHAGGKGEIGEGQEASKRPLVHHNKLAEMHRLENTLCDQNQELMRLEQAYNQLHHHYNSSPSLALASILNNSH